MIPPALFARLPRIAPADPAARRHRALLARYLGGPLPAVGQVLGEPCAFEPAPDRAPCVPDAWWRLVSGALVGLSGPALDALHLFHGRAALPSGPDDLFARLAVDRPAAFSRAVPEAAPPADPARRLALWLRAPGGDLEFVYQFLDGYPPDYPVPSCALDFEFPCRLVLNFLSMSHLAGARRDEMIFPGWPTKDSAYLGRHDLWLPVRFEHGRWVASGGWFMKPSAPDHFPLEISVEVGRIRLRGSDLAALTRGAVLPLGGAFGGQVDLVCDNRLLARAELVVAGGELALRLLTDVPMFPDEPHPGGTTVSLGEKLTGDA